MRWMWAEMGAHGGMVISKAPVSLTVHWPRNGGCVARWWIGSRCVLTVQPAQA